MFDSISILDIYTCVYMCVCIRACGVPCLYVCMCVYVFLRTYVYIRVLCTTITSMSVCVWTNVFDVYNVSKQIACAFVDFSFFFSCISSSRVYLAA